MELFIPGYPLFQLTRKLKILKIALKNWNLEEDNNATGRIGSIRKQLTVVHEKLQQDNISENLHKEEAKSNPNFTWLALEEEQLRQKSEEIWLQLADRNSLFFHSSIKTRQARNCISQLYTDTGRKVSNMEDIKRLASAFYQNLFNQSDYWRVFPKLVVKKKLTIESQDWLIREVTQDEIQSALFQMNPEKSPGPDGFNCGFFAKELGYCGQ